MSDLLKQSIADAKAVRETALANAKSFLEENFASSMKEMFADKLAEDMESDVAEDIGTSEIGGDEGNMASDQDPVEPSEISSETSTDTSGDSTEVVEGECADEDASEEAAEEIDEEASLTNEELDAILKELSEDDEEAAEEVVDAEADAVSDEEIVADEIDEEIDLDEVLAELEGDIAEEAVSEEAVSEEVVAEEAASEEVVSEDAVSEEAVSEEVVAEEADVELEEDVNIEEMAHAIVAMNEENDSLKSTLSEHEHTIKYLKKVLSETNLLNAKLLYTNKLFKGRRLSEDQKMKVINTFDLTKSIREVKLAYSVLAESFNSGASVALKKTNATAQAITEGLASKPVKSTKPNLIVETEVSDMASRFQKLAGIVK